MISKCNEPMYFQNLSFHLGFKSKDFDFVLLLLFDGEELFSLFVIIFYALCLFKTWEIMALHSFLFFLVTFCNIELVNS